MENFRDIVAALPKNKSSHPGLRLIECQLSMPFEWKAARRYGSSNGARCLAVDSGELAKNELPLWDSEILSRKNLMAVANQPFPKSLLSGAVHCNGGNALYLPKAENGLIKAPIIGVHLN